MVDFARLEDAFGVVLPDIYKEVFRGDPFDGDPTEALRDHFFVDTERLLEVNRRVRADGYRGLKWPKTLFIIGCARPDAYSAIDLKPKPGETRIYAVIPEDQPGRKNVRKVAEALTFQEFFRNVKAVERANRKSAGRRPPDAV